MMIEIVNDNRLVVTTAHYHDAENARSRLMSLTHMIYMDINDCMLKSDESITGDFGLHLRSCLLSLILW
jgi:hypothetical protein